MSAASLFWGGGGFLRKKESIRPIYLDNFYIINTITQPQKQAL